MAQLSRGRRLMGEINVVPYIDVMLVLLIIFMVTAPLLTQGVKVELPRAGAEPLDPSLTKNSNPLVLSIDREGRLYLNVGSNPRQALDEVTVQVRVAAALRRNPEVPVLLKADYRIEYGQVMSAMVLLQRAGATKVGFVSEPLPEPPRRS
ncbi:MAG TPA: protein TolR [Steroidobacteraceae bacterium]|nr:protein TolR [Steroidobacteraceae bacterium]